MLAGSIFAVEGLQVAGSDAHGAGLLPQPHAEPGPQDKVWKALQDKVWKALQHRTRLERCYSASDTGL